LNSKRIAATEQAPQRQNATSTTVLTGETENNHQWVDQSSGPYSQRDSNSSLSLAEDVVASRFVPKVRNSFLMGSRYSSVATSPRTSPEVNASRRSDHFSSTSYYRHIRRSSEMTDERFGRDGMFHSQKLSTTSSGAASLFQDALDTGHESMSAPNTPANHDFELMQSHRKSQAAEMGQLTPRSRRPVSKDRSERFHDSARSSYEIQPFLSVEIPNARLSASLEPDSIITRPSTFEEQPVAMEALQASGSSDRTMTEKMITELRLVTSRDNQMSMASQNDGASLTALPQRSSFEVRDSPVVRGRGSGFEILKPGTFKCTLPPISLHNSTQSRGWDKGRKLQKRPRSSDGSSKISFEERRRSRAGSLPTP
jgi:hypothetical protein